MNVLMVTDWGWSEMLWVALISICLVFLVLQLLVWVMKGFGVAFSHRNAMNPASVDFQRVIFHCFLTIFCQASGLNREFWNSRANRHA